MLSRWLPALGVALFWAAPALAQGLLVPSDTSLPPLKLVKHDVSVEIDEQVATTKVTQVYHNDGPRPLEATYVFPVPRGANVNTFSMWIDGKETKAELVEADKARQIYTDIVRRAQDPGLLEYVGSNLLKVRVFPVPANGDQKLAFSYTAIVPQDNGLCEYVYPLRTSEKDSRTQAKVHFEGTIRSKGVVTNVYSPSHKITTRQKGDHECEVKNSEDKAALDKDLTVYYAVGGQDVGLTAVPFRGDSENDGHVMLLISPRAELGKAQSVPRDFVFVLDTSGSMAGAKIEQGKNALKFCLANLGSQDRFAVLNFATSVNEFSDTLSAVNSEKIEKAKKWVDGLQSTGGTAIDGALNAALKFCPADSARTFTVVFFTDGLPTVGETNAETIVKNVLAKKTTNTRIFTFGVGDDVNAAMLDKLADETRAVSTYVRPEEDIEVKVSGLYGKISHPVLTDLKLKATGGGQLSEMYPSQLPDLFHGGQIVVLARYSGNGSTALTLTGKVGGEEKESVYEIELPKKTDGDKAFVEGLWARRKVGYLLDQIRNNGENKELVDEVVKLAKKHGITTPYTSYLLTPDASPRVPVAQTVPLPAARYLDGVAPGTQIITGSGPAPQPGRINYAPAAVAPPMNWANQPVTSATMPSPTYYASGPQAAGGAGAPPSAANPHPLRGHLAIPKPTAAPAPQSPQTERFHSGLNDAEVEGAHINSTAPLSTTAQTGTEGVNLALQLDSLKSAAQVSAGGTRQAAGRTFAQLNGVWTDLGLTAEMKTVKVKLLSDAYFLLLKKHPELKDVFQMGSRVVLVTPSGVALIITDDGVDRMSDDEIEQLFAVKK